MGKCGNSMYRSIIEDLKRWKNSNYRKPLILQGARKTGKTWIMKEFGKTEYKNTAYLLCHANTALEELFNAPFDKDRLLNGFQLICGFKIEPEETLIIIDEIQEIPKALTSLKFFCDHIPEYHIVCAGFFPEVSLHKDDFFTDGKISFLNLYPLSFTEFLLATGKEQLANLINDLHQEPEVLRNFSSDFSEYLKYYFYIGGMPEVVSAWIETKDFSEVRRFQKELLASYENDISKYAASEMAKKIKRVWDSIPSQLAKENKKFLYSVVKETARAREYENAVNWLENAGLLIKIHRVNKPGVPLKSYENLAAFKIFILDTGLLCCMINISAKVLLERNRLFTEYNGALTEQYVCQQMLSELKIEPSYWSAKNGTAEIEFIFQNEDEIIPVEVNAENNLQAKNFKVYRDTYNPQNAFKFSLGESNTHEVLKNIPLFNLPYVKKWLEK